MTNKKKTYAQGIKPLSAEQKQAYKEHEIIPDDFWNYGINPILGYRNHPIIKRRIVENSYPNPVKE